MADQIMTGHFFVYKFLLLSKSLFLFIELRFFNRFFSGEQHWNGHSGSQCNENEHHFSAVINSLDKRLNV